MEGIGNDYIYINNMSEQVPEDDFPTLSRAVSDRHFGIGADGLIVVLPPRTPEHDFRFRMFNADGSEGEMCGNGIRCYARFVYEQGLTQKTRLRVDTLAGTIILELILENGAVKAVRVDMGPPRLASADLPMAGPPLAEVRDQKLTVDGQEYTFSGVSMGNPHLVIFTDAPEAVPLEQVGPKLEHHPLFPRRTNVHFAKVLAPNEIRMRTWERGSGITLACGTGACAVLVAAHRKGLAGRQARIHLPGGALDLEWAADNHVYKTGPATEVCTGIFTRAWAPSPATR